MENTALVLIDLQNDYFGSFEDSKWPLHETEKAASNALKILNKFREKNMKIVHVRHEFDTENPPFFTPSSEGAKIYDTLTPKENESQVLKYNVTQVHLLSATYITNTFYYQVYVFRNKSFWHFNLRDFMFC